MTHEEIIELLINAGFGGGWAISGNELVLWEHEEEPPSPLMRPN